MRWPQLGKLDTARHDKWHVDAVGVQHVGPLIDVRIDCTARRQSVELQTPHASREFLVAPNPEPLSKQPAQQRQYEWLQLAPEREDDASLRLGPSSLRRVREAWQESAVAEGLSSACAARSCSLQCVRVQNVRVHIAGAQECGDRRACTELRSRQGR